MPRPRHALRDFLPDFQDLAAAQAFLAALDGALGQVEHVREDRPAAPTTLHGTFPLTLGRPEQCPEEGSWSFPITDGPEGLWGEVGEIQLAEWRTAIQRRVTELSRPGDPHPHASYLVVLEDGTVVGEAEGHAGGSLFLSLSIPASGAPDAFWLKPYHVPEGRAAPAMVGQNAYGTFALARGKQDGSYWVRTYVPWTVFPDGTGRPSLLLSAVHEAWRWRRVQESIRERFFAAAS